MAKLSSTTRKNIKQILDLGGLSGDERKVARARLEKAAKEPGGPTLVKQVLAQTKGAAAGQQTGTTKGQIRETSRKAYEGTRKTSSRKRLPKSVKARAGKITRAIAAGKIVAKQGKAKPSDYPSGTTREKYDRFITLYKGVVVGRKGGKKGPSVMVVYAQIVGRKYPYYLSRGYHVKAFNVGGGRGGIGIIRAIPKSGAPTFSKLQEGKKKTIVNFLNSAKGQKLRSKGAPKTASWTQAKAQGA